MYKKILILYLLYGGIAAAYLNQCYINPFDFLNGMDGGFCFFEIVQWIMLYFPVWGLGLYQCDKAFCETKFAVHRHHSIMDWWRIAVLRIVIGITGAYFVLFLVIVALQKFKLTFNDLKPISKVFIHSLGLSAIGVCLKLLFGSTIFSGISLILIEILGFNIVSAFGIMPQYVFSTWGLNCYSNTVYGNGGYNTFCVMVIQILLLVGVFIPNASFTNNIILRRLSDERND